MVMAVNTVKKQSQMSHFKDSPQMLLIQLKNNRIGAFTPVHLPTLNLALFYRD